MTSFVLLCGLMLVVALAWVLWPLLRGEKRDAGASSSVSSIGVSVLVAIAVSLLSVGIYLHLVEQPGLVDTNSTEVAQAAQKSANADAQAELKAFEARVQAAPDDVQGWLLLGQAQLKVKAFAQSVQSYQRAYELSKGSNLDATTGLIEALVMTDPASAQGRAALLVEEALKLAPNHPKALWYGGLIALQASNYALARERFRQLLALNPPDNVRNILQQELAALDAQLGEPSAAANTAAAPTHARSLEVHVALSPTLQAKLSSPRALFVLARRAQGSGPPLAVERHQSSELPLVVTLNASDAMLPSMSIDTVDEVEVVARVSASGQPQESAGDLVGSARYSFAKQGAQGIVTIEINRLVP